MHAGVDPQRRDILRRARDAGSPQRQVVAVQPGPSPVCGDFGACCLRACNVSSRGRKRVTGNEVLGVRAAAGGAVRYPCSITSRVSCSEETFDQGRRAALAASSHHAGAPVRPALAAPARDDASWTSDRARDSTSTRPSRRGRRITRCTVT
jgi:hypothetical protein